MDDERMLKLIRNGLEKASGLGQVTPETMVIFLLLKQYEKLEEIRCGLIGVEQEIVKLNPEYK